MSPARTAQLEDAMRGQEVYYSSGARPGRVRVDTARIGKDSHGDRLVADLIGDAEIGH